VIDHGRQEEISGAAGGVRDPVGNQAAGARFRDRKRLAPAHQPLANRSFERLRIHAIDDIA